jgi:hypothetical protein
MIRIEGADLEMLKTMLNDTERRENGSTPAYLLRVDWRGDKAAFKVNEGCWTHGVGSEQQPY